MRPKPMDPGDAPTGEHGPSEPATTPPLRRRYSMEEDLHYNHIMIAPPQRRPSQPPPYRPCSTHLVDDDGRTRRRGSKTRNAGVAELQSADDDEDSRSEALPGYQSTVSIEGVFAKKHEIENTTKRAEDRHWHTVFVALHGTALHVYTIKKDWGWGKTRDGPTISPDNPPWVRKSKIDKSYSLLHADAGIAADYTKRRYVIRVRAETDQFLLSCIELGTFVKWLECLFAAIDLAAPIDDRDFPRDMSIPRVQRIRWLQGQSPALPGYATSSASVREVDAQHAAQASTLGTTLSESGREAAETGSAWEQALPLQSQSQPGTLSSGTAQSQSQAGSSEVAGGPPRMEPRRRLSTTTYPNPSVDPHTGKWFPEHKWSSAHDLLYAKLCYSNLLFRSPRKSNYIISKGKQWFVDWATGRMVRVLPPTYGEVSYFGPWQVIHTENSRI